MIDRYLRREIMKNNLEMYQTLFKDRNVKYIRQYETPEYKSLNASDLSKLKIIEHYWAVGDRYYKLAYKYYGDSSDWWIIAQFNNKPTDAHVSIGDKILIPTPVAQVISLLRG
jgi:hypothetical protein